MTQRGPQHPAGERPVAEGMTSTVEGNVSGSTHDDLTGRAGLPSRSLCLVKRLATI